MDNEKEKMEQNTDASLMIENESGENPEQDTLSSGGKFKKRRESLMDRSVRDKRKKEREKKSFNPKWILLVVALLLAAVILTVVVKKFSASTRVMELTDYYKVPDNEVMIVLHDTATEKNGIYQDGQIYIPYENVVGGINKRFYFDGEENILSFTTANEIIRTEVGVKEYYSNKSKTELDYEPVKTNGEAVYISLAYIKLFSNVEYEFYKKPNRVVIEAGWGNTYSYYKVNKAAKLRYAASKKSDILADLQESDVLRVLDAKDSTEGYAKVMTKDGVIGYAPRKYLSDVYKEKMENDYKEENYSHITKDEAINLAWHQVTSQSANSTILNVLSSAKGVNVISPTWFAIEDNDGSISSIASESYVKKAHDHGLEVWALCNDFNASKGKISIGKVLGKTTSRDKLVNGLLASAIQYNLDGINIDFENISKEAAPAYLEFLRELSVKCRNNGIVLSVDSYVPSDYSAYYDREEQGKVVDYVVVMAYDEHYGGSQESGSVASIGFVKNAVDQIVEMVDPKQVIVGIPFYTRLWREQSTDSGVKVSSVAYSMKQAELLLKNNGVKTKWDKETGQNYGEYEKGDSVYKIWMEDDKSLELKLQTIFKERKQGKVAGVAGWKLGLQKDSVWNLIKKYTN